MGVRVYECGCARAHVCVSVCVCGRAGRCAVCRVSMELVDVLHAVRVAAMLREAAWEVWFVNRAEVGFFCSVGLFPPGGVHVVGGLLGGCCNYGGRASLRSMACRLEGRIRGCG